MRSDVKAHVAAEGWSRSELAGLEEEQRGRLMDGETKGRKLVRVREEGPGVKWGRAGREGPRRRCVERRLGR